MVVSLAAALRLLLAVSRTYLNALRLCLYDVEIDLHGHICTIDYITNCTRCLRYTYLCGPRVYTGIFRDIHVCHDGLEQRILFNG